MQQQRVPQKQQSHVSHFTHMGWVLDKTDKLLPTPVCLVTKHSKLQEDSKKTTKHYATVGHYLGNAPEDVQSKGKLGTNTAEHHFIQCRLYNEGEYIRLSIHASIFLYIDHDAV